MPRSKYKLKSRRAQAASGAGLTIIMVSILIILYILFMAPNDRAALLGEDQAGGGNLPPGAKTNLFVQSPGRIFPDKANFEEHTIPSFMVFTATNANELKRIDNIYVKNSAFSDQSGEMVFLYDSKSMKDLKLSFNTVKSKGILTIKLNKYKIFEGEIESGSPPPINIPKEFLIERNTLTFEVSKPGAAFWRYNEYQLGNLLVSASVTDFTGAYSEQHFTITDQEKESLKKAIFEFLPDCPPREGGILEIMINNRKVYNTYPDCGVKTAIEISEDFFWEGDNILTAKTDKGSFIVDLPKITTFLEERVIPVYYFTVNQDLHQSIYYGEAGLLLTLRFANTGIKRGLIDINGQTSYFESGDIGYQMMIPAEQLFPGQNAIRITPQNNPIDVAELRVDII